MIVLLCGPENTSVCNSNADRVPALHAPAWRLDPARRREIRWRAGAQFRTDQTDLLSPARLTANQPTGLVLPARARLAGGDAVESFLRITLNGEQKEVPGPLSVAELVRHLGLRPSTSPSSSTKAWSPGRGTPRRPLSEGDVLEVVTLVGGGAAAAQPFEPLKIGTHSFHSRLFVGTGKYSSLELMRDCLDASGAEVVTVAVRRERLFDKEGRNLLDYLDPRRYTILPNTAGCFSAEDALRTARLGRELLEGLGNRGASWVKLEVLADTRTLLPDPLATLEATRILVEGRLRGAVLHQRRPGDGPPAQGGRGGQRDAGRQPDRQRPGRAQPQ